MIWALLWCAYLGIGCAIVFPDIPRGIGLMNEARRETGGPPVTAVEVFIVSFLIILTWPLGLRVGPRR